jgi:hypothetical protein
VKSVWNRCEIDVRIAVRIDSVSIRIDSSYKVRGGPLISASGPPPYAPPLPQRRPRRRRLAKSIDTPINTLYGTSGAPTLRLPLSPNEGRAAGGIGQKYRYPNPYFVRGQGRPPLISHIRAPLSRSPSPQTKVAPQAVSAKSIDSPIHTSAKSIDTSVHTSYERKYF